MPFDSFIALVFRAPHLHVCTQCSHSTSVLTYTHDPRYNRVDVSPMQMWNNHGFSRNVTMEVRQGQSTTPPVAVATLNFTEHDPYDVNKQ